MRTMVFSDRVNKVFDACNTNYEAMNNLMQDVALGRELYDAENDRVISKAEANAKILEFSRQIFGITDMNDRKAVRRAIRDNGREWFDIIEDTVDLAVTKGFEDSEWFNALVDMKNIAFGDRQDFYVENDAVLVVTKAGVSHHDHVLQRIGAGQTVPVPTSRYVVKIGADINKYLLGQVEWDKLIAAIAYAFMNKIQETIYSQVSTAAAKLPVQNGFVDSAALTSGNKGRFDTIIENVSAANEGSEVIIMGTKAALKQITNIADVTWASAGQKDSKAMTGLIGYYDGVRLVEIPQRFKDSTLTTKLFPDTKLLIMPADSDKFVKFVDEGDTEITEVTEKGEANGRWDDLMSYEVQRSFGATTVIGKIFGQWTITP